MPFFLRKHVISVIQLRYSNVARGKYIPRIIDILSNGFYAILLDTVGHFIEAVGGYAVTAVGLDFQGTGVGSRR